MEINNKTTIFPILLVNFIGSLGFSIVLPFLVILVLDLGGNEVIYGILGATYSFFQLIGAPILGSWSDNVGRKKILLLSQAGTFLAWVIFLVALLLPNEQMLSVESKWLGSFILTIPLLLLFIARALDGITGGNISVANAYLSDISNDKNRKKNFGQMSAASNLGFVIGPAIAGILGSTQLGNILPVIVALLISFIAIFLIAFRLKESLKFSTEKTETQERVKHSFWQILKLKNIPLLIGLYFLIYLAFNFFYVAFPVHSVQFLEWDIFRIGVFFSVLSGVMVIVQGPILFKLSNKITDKTLVITGNVILAGSFYLFTRDIDVAVFAGGVLFSIGNGIMWPSFLSILSSLAGEKYQGAVHGYGSSAGSLASIIGLLAGGILYAGLGSWIFLFSVIIFLVIAFITSLIKC